jgi:hypothetical protein
MNQDFVDLIAAFNDAEVDYLIVGAHALAAPGTIFQIGVAPVRIDVITTIDGVEFDEAWRARVPTVFGGKTTAVLSRAHLIQNKRASGRLQDLADVERLERGDQD